MFVSIEAFGALSVLTMVCSRATYFTSIFRGVTRPNAFSWFIWGTISGIGFAAQVAEGAGPGAWARGFASMTCFVIVIMALVYGRRDIRKIDWLTFAVAMAAIPLWVITKTPVWSVIIVCIIDTLGYYPTVRKSWDRPHEEAVISYVFSSLGSLFAIFALDHYSLSTWLYSAVLFLSNGSMAAFLLLRRRLITS